MTILPRIPKNTLTLIAAAAVLAAFALLGFFLLQKPPEARSLDSVSYWRERIERAGAAAAYEEFAAAMKGRVQTEQHTSAHVFGEAMWEEKGVEGLLVCDQRFANGCAHQLVGLEILQKGPGSIATMREVCPQGNFNEGVCLHSIGHGILGYFGYREDGLRHSLEECQGTFKDPAAPVNINCYLGVFMEYNTQRLATDGLRDTRTPTDGNLLASCGEFENDPAWACIYVLPNWWRFLMIEEGLSNETKIFEQIRTQCESVVPEQFLNACYGGAGYLLAFNLDNPPEEKARLCEAATPGPQEELLCKKHLFTWLSIIYATLPDTPYRAEVVCDGLEQTLTQECRSFVRLGLEDAGAAL
jgi:hypothetical protein